MPKSDKNIGMKFNMLCIASLARATPRGAYYNCLCDCGALHVARISHLKSGGVQSCGCYKKINKTTHGMSKKPIYTIWSSMIARCTNKKSSSYYAYGARGISVSKSWLRFENFYRDMGDRPAGLQLDRVDNSNGYSKSNCKWASRKEQCSNRRDNNIVIFHGEKMTVTEACRRGGLSLGRIYRQRARFKTFQEIINNELTIKEKQCHSISVM